MQVADDLNAKNTVDETDYRYAIDDDLLNFINSYSYHYKNADGTPSPKVMLEKSIGDKKFIVAECVPDSAAKKIHIISARITKSGNGQVLNMKPYDSPQPTSWTLLDGITTINSITDSDKNVNKKTERTSETAKKTQDQRFALSEEISGEKIKANMSDEERYAIFGQRKYSLRRNCVREHKNERDR